MRKFNLVLLTLAILALASCKKDNAISTATSTQSNPVAVGNGHVWSWVQVNKDNSPASVGITFDKAAFTHLPDGGQDEYEYVIHVPTQLSAVTPFQSIVINWNPHGHPPAHVYDKPHFDMHFYMISEDERMKIPDYMVDSTGFLNYPAAAYLPANYIPIPGGEMMMGTHWADINSPELATVNPQPFTQTFIYGSYNGNVTFYEPMATLAFLTSTNFYTRTIPQPGNFAKAGYYPTQMSFVDRGNTLEVSLQNFVYHTKS